MKLPLNTSYQYQFIIALHTAPLRDQSFSSSPYEHYSRRPLVSISVSTWSHTTWPLDQSTSYERLIHPEIKPLQPFPQQDQPKLSWRPLLCFSSMVSNIWRKLSIDLYSFAHSAAQNRYLRWLGLGVVGKDLITSAALPILLRQLYLTTIVPALLPGTEPSPLTEIATMKPPDLLKRVSIFRCSTRLCTIWLIKHRFFLLVKSNTDPALHHWLNSHLWMSAPCNLPDFELRLLWPLSTQHHVLSPFHQHTLSQELYFM